MQFADTAQQRFSEFIGTHGEVVGVDIRLVADCADGREAELQRWTAEAGLVAGGD